ncbi:MAG TPA: hypothetical protein VIS28_06380 [Nitrososphaeraceae archaeon]
MKLFKIGNCCFGKYLLRNNCLCCGEEFDWENILTETKKYCPLCHEKYPGYANFCAFHNDPKIELIPS